MWQNKNTILKFSNIFLGGLIIFIISACSTIYHNSTARYNAWFIAKERMLEIENHIAESTPYNFDDILYVFPPSDSNILKGVSTQVEDCMKKSSLAIERHKNSKWVDDCYILIGRVRYYKQEFSESIETFKYVNVKSKDSEARHEALIWLYRSFIDYNEVNNAIAVSDYLKKEKLNKEHIVSLTLSRAYFYQQQKNFDRVLQHLAYAAPLMKRGEEKSKAYFILGQIYQKKNKDKEAYESYKSCLRSNPSYELAFYAKLNMTQVADVEKVNDLKQARKYFKKLLKDAKNKDFRDKIYYEMAKFEKKQDNLDGAIEYYNASIRSNTKNNRLKSHAYLKLGEIYYEDLKKYELAKVYYDSTVSVMPPEEPNFEQIKKRQEVLGDFVAQLQTIHKQDSLLALASMDSIELDSFLDKLAQQKIDEAIKRKEEQEKKAKTTAQNPTAFFQNQQNQFNDNSQSGQWYFYNVAAISVGRSEFIQKWGNRSLEDNWRRSDRSTTLISDSEEVDSLQSKSTSDESLSLSVETLKKQMYKDIPFSESQQKQAHQKIEEAYYKLGKIYNFDLKEKQNAIETFEKLIQRYSNSQYIPEVSYFIYIIAKELQLDLETQYKNKILDEFPNSIYAKLIHNPNYQQESIAATKELKISYKKAYEFFEIDSLVQANVVIDNALLKHPDTEFTDNLMLLKILILGKTADLYTYQFQLSQFIEKYPESELLDYAKELLQASKNIKTKIAKRKGAQYIQYFDQEHKYVFLLKSKNKPIDQIMAYIEQKNDTLFNQQQLVTSTLIIDNKNVAVIVDKFRNKEEAFTYFEKIQSELKIMHENKLIFDNFVISKDNFQILYQTKDIKSYLAFFNKYYLQ